MFHIQRVFFSPLKRPPTHKHGNVTAEHKPKDQMFVDESCNPCTREHITHYSWCFSVMAHPLVGYSWLSSSFSAGTCRHRYLLLIFPGCPLCPTVTIPRRLHGWTPAWQRRRSPLRSVRMEVCRLHYSARLLKHTVIPLSAAHVFTQGHTYNVCAMHKMIHHFTHFHTINHITS